MPKAKNQKVPQTKCKLSPVQSTRVCITRTANAKVKEEKYKEWKFSLTTNEYSIVDVFAYPFMAAVIRYLMQSCKPLLLPPSDERRKLNVAAICSCTNCICDSKEHKAMLSKYEKCGSISSDYSSDSETKKPDCVVGIKDASSEQKSVAQTKKDSSSKAKTQHKKSKHSKAKKKSAKKHIRKKLEDSTKISLLHNVKIKDKKQKIPLYEIFAARKIRRLKLGPLMKEIKPVPLKLFAKALKILFLNRNKYEGYFDQMVMNGFGRLRYHNGASYKGKFKNGMAHGFGMMTWQDGTYYQGTMKKNKKHGRGSLVFFKDGNSQNDTNIYKAHFGCWKRGKKHKHGLTVFGKNNWYEGNWENGQMHGFGIRCYHECCYYAGYLKNGLREGYGVMKWPNRDMYYGNWKEGKMHGVGTYVWKAFRVTEWLISPFQNSYIGEWKNGLRHGKGTLYLSNGAKVIANWRKGKKHGYGEVICANGKKIVRNKLFYHDKIVDTLIPIADPLPKNENDKNENNEEENKEIALKSNASPAVNKAQTTTSETLRPEGYLPECVAVNAPLYTMDFDPHIYKIFVPDICPEIYPDDTDFSTWVSTGKRNSIYNLEREWLQKVIIKRGPELNFIYNKYATGGSSKHFEFKPALMRIALWKMLRDGGLFLTKKSLVDMDEEVGLGDKPFDQIAMYEMVHYLLILSWENFAKQKLFNPNIPGILASAFDRYIEDVLVPMAHGYCGNILTLFRYVPLKALYTLFNSIKKPITVLRLEKIIQPIDDSFQDILPRPSKFIRKLAKGLNIFHPDGSLEYLPTHDPYFDLVYERKASVQLEGSDLSILGLLGYNIFLQVLLEVLPNIITLEGSIREDYEVTFLDFCDILSELIILYLDKVHGDLEDEDLEMMEEEEEEEDDEDEGEEEEDDEEEDFYEGGVGDEEEEMEYLEDNGNGDGDDDDEMDEENDEDNVVKKVSDEIAGEEEEELIPGYRKDRLCFDVPVDDGVEDFGEGESSSRLSFLLGDSGSDVYKSGQEDQLLEDLRFTDEDEIDEDKEDDALLGEILTDLVVCDDEEIVAEEEEEEIMEDEIIECDQEHECIEPLEKELSCSSENEVNSNVENLSDKIKGCFKENMMEPSEAHFRSFLNILVGSKENYKNYPCMAYLKKSKKLMEMFNNLVNKSGLLHKKRFKFIKSRLENEFIKRFLNTKLRHGFKKKKLKSESPPIQDTPDDSEISDDESTISSNLCDYNKFFPIDTDSSDDWAGKSESTNSTIVSKKSSSSFQEEPEICSSVSSNSTFTSIMDTDSDNPNYELNYTASDTESESHKDGSSSSPITDTLSSTSDETSIGFTRLGIVCKKSLPRYPTKSSSFGKGVRASKAKFALYRPQLIVHKKRKSRRRLRLKAKKLQSKIAEALFGKDGGRKKYIDMLLRLGGIKLLEELKDTLRNKMEINEIVFYKEDFLKNETEELDNILEKQKKEKVKPKLSKEYFVKTTSELNISSEEEKSKQKIYDFDRYTHMFNMKNHRPIDYAYFFDIPPTKHPLIVVGEDGSSDDETTKDSNY